MTSATAALLGGVVCLVAAPYLARLTLSVPERDDARWWAGWPSSPARVAATALVAAVLGVLAGAAANEVAELPGLLVLALLATPLAVIDHERHRLPNRLVFPLAVAAPVFGALAAWRRDDWYPLLRAAEAAGVVLAVLFALAFAAPRAFGYGDVKLGGVLAGYLGWFGWAQVYYGLLAGFVLGAVFALVRVAAGRATMRSPVAFGPALVSGALVVLALDLVPAG